jgi:hypothetical protein
MSEETLAPGIKDKQGMNRRAKKKDARRARYGWVVVKKNAGSVITRSYTGCGPRLHTSCTCNSDQTVGPLAPPRPPLAPYPTSRVPKGGATMVIGWERASITWEIDCGLCSLARYASLALFPAVGANQG